MIYRTDNDSFALQGVTENCFTSFGIPAQLMYGNNSNNVEFTVGRRIILRHIYWHFSSRKYPYNEVHNMFVFITFLRYNLPWVIESRSLRGTQKSSWVSVDFRHYDSLIKLPSWWRRIRWRWYGSVSYRWTIAQWEQSWWRWWIRKRIKGKKV